MNFKSLIRLGLVIVIFAASVWYSLTKPVKLGLDLKGGAYVVLEAIPEGNNKIDNNAMNRLIEVLDRRVNGIGVAESAIQKAGDNRVIIELPGLQNTEDAINLIGKTALLEFKLMGEDGSLGETLLTGSYLKSADVSYDNLGRPQIQFEMTPEGAQKFAQITRENIGKQLAITLDGVVQTAPRINSEIPSGNGVITGNYTVEEAKATATLLNAGALPVKAEIVETRTVGASLGDESIAQSKNAGIVSIVLIWAFMLFLYRLPGIVANIAIILFGFITFACLNFIDATLTLPGIAGFILSLGMAVDANVIIFERIKDELSFGNTIRNSVEAGFNKGFIAIFDSNLTTLIVAAILFVFGTGPIKGFAVTLALGTAASMFTAITATKVILLAFINLFGLKDPKVFGVKLEGNN
ncbi:MAG: protein translocase subunit SecD [Fusobacterium gastrosuis]|uniref:protein translocase subunit SecD n=1 Tax=Fusobacterium TaxID=848 RepID=UPI0025B8CAA9|nr:protein translocase subunit SecD [Fusobacterium sp.]MCI7223364.1 protein translocase subunit SecD [Fusobacterium sp.]MDD7391646.1 protein translocase subunit SecD [Fusobacteriaceae bacterium]MDY5794765.1 protein translocase subunit SecD [Fusobacterium gastrosuis]